MHIWILEKIRLRNVTKVHVLSLSLSTGINYKDLNVAESWEKIFNEAIDPVKACCVYFELQVMSEKSPFVFYFYQKLYRKTSSNAGVTFRQKHRVVGKRVALGPFLMKKRGLGEQLNFNLNF